MIEMENKMGGRAKRERKAIVREKPVKRNNFMSDNNS